MRPPPVIELIRGKDGKRYPVMLCTPAEHRCVIALIHNMRHVEHLSYPAIQRALLERHAIRRSLGMVWKDANHFRCPNCEPGAARMPAPAEVPRPAPVPRVTAAAPPPVKPQVFEWR